MKKLSFRAPAFAGTLALLPRFASACAVCFGRDAGQAGLARGFFWGILLLLLLPLGLIAFIGGRIFMAIRRQEALRQAPLKT